MKTSTKKKIIGWVYRRLNYSPPTPTIPPLTPKSPPLFEPVDVTKFKREVIEVETPLTCYDITREIKYSEEEYSKHKLQKEIVHKLSEIGAVKFNIKTISGERILTATLHFYKEY